jgi:hypothetical protein
MGRNSIALCKGMYLKGAGSRGFIGYGRTENTCSTGSLMPAMKSGMWSGCDEIQMVVLNLVAPDPHRQWPWAPMNRRSNPTHSGRPSGPASL